MKIYPELNLTYSALVIITKKSSQSVLLRDGCLQTVEESTRLPFGKERMHLAWHILLHGR